MMTKKNFEAIAEALRQSTVQFDETDGYFERGRLTQSLMVVSDLADVFAADNPRFDRQKFLEACAP